MAQQRDATPEPDLDQGDRRRWLTRWVARVDDAVRTRIGDHDEDAVRRARMLLIFAYVFVMASLVAIFEFARRGMMLTVVAATTGALITACAPLWLRRRRSLELVGNALLGLLVVAISGFAVLAGGLGAPILYVLVVVPVLATATIGSRAGVVWAAIVLADFTWFTTLYLCGWSPASELSSDDLIRGHAAAGITITVVIVIVVQVYERLTRSALRRARSADERRQRLLRRTIASQEDERRRLARDLHDSVGSLVTSVAVSLRALEESEPSPNRRQELETLRGHAKMILDETRRLVHGLHPLVLEAHGLEEAVRQYATEWSTSNNVATDIHMNGIDRSQRLPPSVEMSLYRIVQETLANVAKHAHASTVSILLRRDQGRIRLIVEDDGRGFSVEATPSGHGFGLRTIGERAAQHGGRLSLESEPGVGTSVYVEIPEKQE